MLTLKRRASNKGHLILILWPVGMINPRATTKVFYIDIDIDIGIDIDIDIGIGIAIDNVT